MQETGIFPIGSAGCRKQDISYRGCRLQETKIIPAEAQLGGGRPGARPPLAPERGGARPPLQNEKKERMPKISITGIRKPIELL